MGKQDGMINILILKNCVVTDEEKKIKLKGLLDCNEVYIMSLLAQGNGTRIAKSTLRTSCQPIIND